MVVGFKRALQMEDLPPLLPTDTAAHISKAFKRRWHDQVRSDVWGRSFFDVYACKCFAIGVHLQSFLLSALTRAVCLYRVMVGCLSWLSIPLHAV